MIVVEELRCVDCEHFQLCLQEYDMVYEELSDCSICGNFELGKHRQGEDYE